MLPKLLCFCDSPTTTTGFSRVAQNLLRRCPLPKEQIHVWGIGFNGMRYDESPWKVFPAGSPWNSPKALSHFLEHLHRGGYTHLWMMQDLFQLSQAEFPLALRQACGWGKGEDGRWKLEDGRKQIHTTLYFPVDADWMPSAWTEILGAVDAAVAYTEFGKVVTESALARRRSEAGRSKMEDGGRDPSSILHPPSSPLIRILPHGVDTALYHPLDVDRAELRRKLWTFDGEPWVQPGDFLMLNVNTNQRRKDITRSLEILAGLVALDIPAKLVLHMAESSDGRASIEATAEQLGLTFGKEYIHHGDMFKTAYAGLMPERELVRLYHAADLLLTTTLGEGWGLSITEALASGCPVAMPLHTGCQEIYSRLMGWLAVGDPEDWFVPLRADEFCPVLDADNSLRRPRVNLDSAVQAIAHSVAPLLKRPRHPLPRRVREWLDWDRIAKEMWSVALPKQEKHEDGRSKMEDGKGRDPSSILHPPSSTQ